MLSVEDMTTIMTLSCNLVWGRGSCNKEPKQNGDRRRARIVETTYNASEIESGDSDGEVAVPGWGSPEKASSSR